MSEEYLSYYTTPPTPQPEPEPKKKKNSSGFFNKLLAGCAIGLAFGLCAGLGVYAVNELTGKSLFSTKTVIEGENDESDKSDLEDKIDKLQEAITNRDESDDAPLIDWDSEYSGVVTDVTRVVDKVMPSMVSVSNHYEETYDYWGFPYTQEGESGGTGIIIGENDNEYLLVTNYHVIENTLSLTVQFVNETQAPAFVKGYDASVDIAVIAVSKDDVDADTKKAIKIAKMGDSSKLKIGEPAIAIGNALGYGQSVTTGVISALNRDIEMENTCTKLIQTNAAINPGNSGGALLNIEGEVVGINSNKISSSTIEGMGYAIPVSEVKDIIENLMKRETKKEVAEDEKAYLGVSGATVDDMTSQTYGIPKGVYITEVFERSAAEKYGILKGDVITNIDGQSVRSIEELQKTIATYRGGEEAVIKLLRSGNGGYEEMEITVTFGVRETKGN